MYKVPYNLIFFPTPIFLNLPRHVRPLLLFPLDILPKCLNIIGHIILLPLYIFLTSYSFPHSWYYLSNLIFFPNRPDKLYTPLIQSYIRGTPPPHISWIFWFFPLGKSCFFSDRVKSRPLELTLSKLNTV